jgi:hypothetical protein
MNSFVRRHAGSVTGMLSGFDRIRFRGTVRILSNASGLMVLLSHLSVLLKDFKLFATGVSEKLKAASVAAALQAGRPVRYLPSSRVCKEEVALRIAQEQRIDRGLICVLTAVEPCWSFHVRRDRASQQLVLEPSWRKCLHLYHYFLHEQLGFCHARVQSWLPFNVHICVNGREMLARQMDRAGIDYQRRDNCFARVSDVARAQALLNEQVAMDWPATLNDLADRAHPARRELLDLPGGHWVPEYYWSAQESEWASDVMFRNPADLSRLYPRLIRHGLTGLSSGDVMRYLGKRVGAENRRFTGEVISDIKQRGEGMRIKHRLNSNSIKMYDKQQSVLRVETTMNDPSDFKVYRRAGGNPQSKLCWRLLRKGVADMERRAQVSQAANDRYLEAMASVDSAAVLGELAEPLCQSVPGKSPGQRARGLNPLAREDATLLQAVSRGEFTINGFRNRDIRGLLYGQADKTVPPAQAKRRSAAMTRKLRLLRAHGLVKKVSHTHRYLLTDKGRQAISTLLAARSATASQLLAAA